MIPCISRHLFQLNMPQMFPPVGRLSLRKDNVVRGFRIQLIEIFPAQQNPDRPAKMERERVGFRLEKVDHLRSRCV